MKRKSSRKTLKKDEGNSNGVEDEQAEQNGETSADEDQAPKDKKRKPSKTSSKKKGEAAHVESEKSSEESEVEVKDLKEKKRPGRKSKTPSKLKPAEEPSEEEEEDNVEESDKKKLNKKGKKAPLTAVSDDEQDEDDESQYEKKSNKKGKKASPKAASDDEQDEDDESQYEVESVLDDKMIGGVRHYLIRWKGYEEESDTWEPEDTLECAALIDEYKERKKKNKGDKTKKSPKKEKKQTKPADWDENEDFEVDRILEVHHKRDGKREFLVSWKGYGFEDNSWEPEENMDCKDLIARFMEKVEKAKEVDEKELRVNRKQVQRYTLSMQERSRRLSKRFSGKERVQYHDAE